jgi:uncharacterized membrane protein SirB2
MDRKTKTRLIDTIGLGFLIWLIGYIASILLWGFVSHDILGWILFVVFTPLMAYLPYRRFRSRNETAGYYFLVALVWLLIAVVFDYLFIVKLFDAKDYYKLDIFVYYTVTFLAPLLIGLKYGTARR